MSNHTLFGWTMKQWAIALGYSDIPVETVKDALEVRRRFQATHLFDISEEPIIYTNPLGSDIRKQDWSTALKLFDGTINVYR